MEEKIVEFMQGVFEFISNIFYDIIVGVIVEFIIAYKYKELPTVSQVKYYSKCKELFIDIDIQRAYALFLKKLKTRNMVSNKIRFDNVPYELKSLVYFSQYTDADYENLNKFLTTKNGGIE